MFGLRPRRTRSDPRLAAFVFGGLGTLLGVIGLATIVHALVIEREMTTDPFCSVAVTVETAPRHGPVCTVTTGTVTSAYTTYGSKGHRTHHVVVTTGAGARLSLALGDLSSPVYAGARAAPGEPAVVETIAGVPAFVATATGTAAGQGDPRGSLASSLVLLIFAAVLAAVAWWFWRRRTRAVL